MRPSLAGFTLIELMVTLAVAAILMSVAAPALQDVIAAQGVRSAASEMLTDLSYARNDAIGNQRSVAVTRLVQGSDLWNQGWRVVACVRSAACAACTDPSDPSVAAACLEEPIRRQPLGGRIKLCTRMNATSVDTPTLIFGPDGRVMDTALGAALHINTIMISDDMGDADAGNDRMRSLEFGPTGRVSLHVVNPGSAAPCS